MSACLIPPPTLDQAGGARGLTFGHKVEHNNRVWRQIADDLVKVAGSEAVLPDLARLR